MKKYWVAAALVLGLEAAVHATNASADDIMVTKAPPPVAAPAQPSSCNGVPDFVLTSCQLSWYGIRIYGTLDYGVGWESHGVPLNSESPPGQLYFIQKANNKPMWGFAPNALSQSNIGIQGKEAIPFASGWSFVFDLEAGFDPGTFQLANGPNSVLQNAGVPLTSQNGGADSSRGGQFYNSLGYFGFSNPTYGTITFFRQNTLTLDGVLAYDPMGGSYAFSPIGFSGTTAGVGDTEDARMTTSAKYRVNIGPIRLAALGEFGGYSMNNASTGGVQGQIGGDIQNLGGGVLSLDAIASYIANEVRVTLVGPTNAAGLPVPYLPQTFTAILSNDTSVMALAKYTMGPVQLYAGFEWIQFAPPSLSFAPGAGFTDISGNFVCSGCAAINMTSINTASYSAGGGNGYLDVMWTGAKYAVTKDLDVIGAYYHYYQPSFFGVAGAPAPCTSSAHAQCQGTMDAVSAVVDWRFLPKWDAYVGLMFSQVNGGLANGYLNRNNVDPTAGFRFRF